MTGDLPDAEAALRAALRRLTAEIHRRVSTA